MTLQFIGSNNTPNYIALSTDVTEGKIVGVSMVGATVLISDTGEWFIVENDESLSPYTLPISISGPIAVSGALTNSELRAMPVSVNGGIYFIDQTLRDAFSRLRVSSPKTIFQSSFQYNLQPILFQALTASGGTITHNSNTASANMSLSTSVASSSILQSRQYARYIPAKSQFIVMSQVIGSPSANTVRRFGYFDNHDGIFMEQNGLVDLAIVRRSSTSGTPIDTRVVQADWNLDKLDGSGVSGFTIDLSKANILLIDLQWLGMGRVRVGFDINGEIVYAHEFLNANSLSVPYMKTGSLPVRWECFNVGSASITSMYPACATVISEGGDETPETYQFSVHNDVDVSVGATRTGLLAIRPKALMNGVTNRVSVAEQNFSFICGTNSVLVEVLYSPTVTVTGGWNSVDTESSVEFHRSITSVTGGILVESFFVHGGSGSTRVDFSSNLSNRYPLSLDIDGTNPTSIVIVGTAFTGTSSSRAAITWSEGR